MRACARHRPRRGVARRARTRLVSRRSLEHNYTPPSVARRKVVTGLVKVERGEQVSCGGGGGAGKRAARHGRSPLRARGPFPASPLPCGPTPSQRAVPAHLLVSPRRQCRRPAPRRRPGRTSSPAAVPPMAPPPRPPSSLARRGSTATSYKRQTFCFAAGPMGRMMQVCMATNRRRPQQPPRAGDSLAQANAACSHVRI